MDLSIDNIDLGADVIERELGGEGISLSSSSENSSSLEKEGRKGKTEDSRTTNEQSSASAMEADVRNFEGANEFSFTFDRSNTIDESGGSVEEGRLSEMEHNSSEYSLGREDSAKEHFWSSVDEFSFSFDRNGSADAEVRSVEACSVHSESTEDAGRALVPADVFRGLCEFEASTSARERKARSENHRGTLPPATVPLELHLAIQMEYCEGSDLKEWLRVARTRPDGLTERVALQVALQVAEGLAYVHSQGLVHRCV